MKHNTKKFWAGLLSSEKRTIWEYDRYANSRTGGMGGYLPDDCSECAVCSQPMLGSGVCSDCSNAYDKAFAIAEGLVTNGGAMMTVFGKVYATIPPSPPSDPQGGRASFRVMIPDRKCLVYCLGYQLPKDGDLVKVSMRRFTMYESTAEVWMINGHAAEIETVEYSPAWEEDHEEDDVVTE